MTNAYDALCLDIIKSTPIRLIEIYDGRTPYYNEEPYKRLDFTHPNDAAYIRLYLSDGEVLQLRLADVGLYIVQDPILHDKRKWDYQGRLPWNTLPDAIYHTNRASQKVAYLLDETCRLDTQHTPKELNPQFAARSPRRYPSRIART